MPYQYQRLVLTTIVPPVKEEFDGMAASVRLVLPV
jgi:hypothetical protein